MALSAPWVYLTDPVLRAPTIGCSLMCLSASLVGVVTFLRKQSLLGEALSHASFPGVIVGVMLTGALSQDAQSEVWLPILTMIGAFISALLGLGLIHYLEVKARIRMDSALSFILSGFFGIGIALASRVQFTYTTLYKQALSYLYGQAATMVDIHIWIYGILSLLIIVVIFLFYKEFQVVIFDVNYAKSLGVRVNLIRSLIFSLVALSIVIGIRSVGVVLMSAMLIAPAVASRQFTNRLSMMMVFAGGLGLFSGFFGVYFSVEMTNYFAEIYPATKVSFPTGPMIVIVAACLCLFALLFAPQRGFIIRLFRRVFFRDQCMYENIIKAMWRMGPNNEYSIKQIIAFQHIMKPYLLFLLMRLKNNGWVEKLNNKNYKLTEDGIHRAAHIVRLHRLWELYLADYLEMGVERVHRSAEEMEHIITPEIEKQLTELLKDPKFDPHHQPIPPFKDIC